jgi:hypothetical protein
MDLSLALTSVEYLKALYLEIEIVVLKYSLKINNTLLKGIDVYVILQTIYR